MDTEVMLADCPCSIPFPEHCQATHALLTWSNEALGVTASDTIYEELWSGPTIPNCFRIKSLGHRKVVSSH